MMDKPASWHDGAWSEALSFASLECVAADAILPQITKILKVAP